MGTAKDQAALDAYRAVLTNLGHVTGYIQWKRVPAEWLHANIPNINARLIHELMIAHAKGGGEIDQVVEKRPQYTSWGFHYDLRLPIAERRVYIETVFMHEPDPEDCTIWIVNLHDV